MAHKHTLRHNAAEQRYEFDLGEDQAVLEYIPRGKALILAHTFVPAGYEGQGIGAELVKAALEDIRNNGQQVIPQCSFVRKYIIRHPEWEEILYEE